MTCPMSISDNYFLYLPAEAIDFYVPLLLEMDIITSLRVLVDFEESIVNLEGGRSSLPVVWTLGPANIE